MKRTRENTISCDVDNINMAHVLMLLSQNGAESTNLVQYYPAREDRIYECKTCKRQFPSFQALGGHRASHKKPRTGSEECTDQAGSASTKPKLHECSICGLEFTIGQALGGHMRRHRQIGNEGFSVHHGMILDINKSCEESDDNGLFHVDMQMPLTNQREIECKKDREPITLNLFL
ncbi:Zinc finger protein [Rhynchospora pubera]|uniref:Zinc finger protein n=1 Tax=Rhynchospora pubera TaxID=906938 RepID=A0AAV8DBV0_9POAL|nr:Zinc finger protein [Rhynchospora pubera]